MTLQGINNSTGATPLRLVQPQQRMMPGAPVPPVPPVETVRRAATDTYQFQTIRETQLPRMPYTQAHQRLEKLRDMIAAKTNVPIHFEEPTQQANGANPYARSYLKFPVNAAERNAAATQAPPPSI